MNIYDRDELPNGDDFPVTGGFPLPSDIEIEYNDHNCERLANHIVDGMELEALLSLAVDVLLERYQKNEEAFREAIEHYYVQEEDLCKSDLI